MLGSREGTISDAALIGGVLSALLLERACLLADLPGRFIGIGCGAGGGGLASARIGFGSSVDGFGSGTGVGRGGLGFFAGP